ncbi:hypothetical protein ACJ41O_007053 [Fusarium nematophilum]
MEVKEKQPAKRRRDAEEQPPQEQPQSEDSDDDDALPPGQDFLKNINNRILPEGEHFHKLPQLRPHDSNEYPPENEGRTGIVIEAPRNEDNGEVAKQGSVRSETGREDVEAAEEGPVSNESPERDSNNPPEQPESSGQGGPAPRPTPPHPESSQAGRRKKRQQSRKEPLGEPDYQEPRDASPELGSDAPRSRAKPPTKRGLASMSRLSKEEIDGMYKFNESNEERNQPEKRDKQRPKPKKDSQAARKRKKPQPQPAERETQAEDASVDPDDLNEDDDGDGDDDENDDEWVDYQQGNASEAVEDSLLVEPSENIVTTQMQGEFVQKLMYIMTLAGWVGKRKWESEILVLAKDAKEELDNLDDHSSIQRSNILLAHLHHLWTLCHNLPRAPRFDAQRDYELRRQGEFKTLLSALEPLIHQASSSLTSLMGSVEDRSIRLKKGRGAVTRLSKLIIPMLVLVLKEAFLAGCDAPQEEDRQPVRKDGEFTAYMLQLLLKAMDWALRLCEVILDWLQLNPPQPKSDSKADKDKLVKTQGNREHLRIALKMIQDETKKAVAQLDNLINAPELQRKAMKHDEEARRARQEREQQRHQAQGQQMQLFIESLERIKSSRPSRTNSAASQSNQADEYLEENGAWHRWEDDRLLSIIRSTPHPEYQNLGDLLPGRTTAEMEQRARRLRIQMRRKYEKEGYQPPDWCYEQA